MAPVGLPDFSYAIPGRYPGNYLGHPPRSQHFPPPGYSSRTIPKDISHQLPLIINPVHKLNLCIEVKLGVLKVHVRVRVWVSVVIRKCAPLFIYLAMNSLTNATSIIFSIILFTYPVWIGLIQLLSFKAT